MQKVVVPSETEVVDRLSAEIEQCAKTAIADRGIFRVGLSGGSVFNYMRTAIPRTRTDLRKWRFYFCDERFVDEIDANSTAGAYKYALVPDTFCAEQFVCINTGSTLEECAKDYEEKVLKEFQLEYGSIPEFDLLVLGMGPDGHTCSLFPGHPLLKEKDRLIAPITNSPKPPLKRVTMTLPIINNAHCCIFTICGESKAEIVKRIFLQGEKLPAGMVSLNNGKLLYIFDKAAGKYLN